MSKKQRALKIIGISYKKEMFLTKWCVKKSRVLKNDLEIGFVEDSAVLHLIHPHSDPHLRSLENNHRIREIHDFFLEASDQRFQIFQ